MTGPWKVSSNIIFDREVYQVYRLRDANAVDHSGNREYSGGYVTSLFEAERLAEGLNQIHLNLGKNSARKKEDS